MLPRSSQLIIHKSNFRPHLDYGDTVCNKPDHSSSDKIGSLQNNAALETTGATSGSSKENYIKN